MIGKIKTLGLAFVAIAALGAVAASAAQAGALDVGSAGQNVVITGHSDPKAGGGFQEHIFTLTSTTGNAVPAKCNTASFEGTTTGGQDITDLTVTATYGQGQGDPTQAQGCTLFGVKAQVLMNGCKYTLTGAGQAANTFLLDIVGCTTGKQIEIKSAICNLDIPDQNGLPHLDITQLASQETTLEATVAGIKVQQTGAACPDGNHTGTNLSFTGNTIVKGFQDSGTTQVTKHKHQYSEHLCGAQLNIQTT